MKKERTITNLNWRDALRTLLNTNNLVTIQADEEGVAHLTKGYNDGEYCLITTEPDGKKPEKIKITKVAALTKLSDFFKYTRKMSRARQKTAQIKKVFSKFFSISINIIERADPAQRVPKARTGRA